MQISVFDLPGKATMVDTSVHTHWIKASGNEGRDGIANHRYAYWSFTKTVISIVSLKLAELGLLDLDMRLSPRPYSIRHLLAHTSGLPDYGGIKAYHDAVVTGSTPWPREKLLETVGEGRLLFEPGASWSYSNIGYMFVRELIEETTGAQLGPVISELVCDPLGLKSIELLQSREQFAQLHGAAAANYDPRWVYHGCLAGTSADAARLLHALLTGDLLQTKSLEEMLTEKQLGGAIAGRPWISCGYSLGLMSGTMADVGKALGHSGGGPSSVSAVYHFPNVKDPVTVACFAAGNDEGITENHAVRTALQRQLRF